ncbi:hypothetical protein ABVT39_007089 [Epinephelus coioides]
MTSHGGHLEGGGKVGGGGVKEPAPSARVEDLEEFIDHHYYKCVMEGPADNPNKRKKTDSATDTQELVSSEFSVSESINKKLEVLGMLHQEIKDLKLVALKLDPDLDSNPPFRRSAPPPYNSATPNERR